MPSTAAARELHKVQAAKEQQSEKHGVPHQREMVSSNIAGSKKLQRNLGPSYNTLPKDMVDSPLSDIFKSSWVLFRSALIQPQVIGLNAGSTE